MVPRHLQEIRETAPPLPVLANAQKDELHLSLREAGDERMLLHFPIILMSDSHLGSRVSRAKRIFMSLRNFSCNRLDCVGDIIDGLHLMKKPDFHMGPWHREVIAQILRIAGEGVEVNYYPGNHEVGLWDKIKTDKKLYNINLRRQGEYTDPEGRRFKIEHSDRYDAQVFDTAEEQANWYLWGDMLFEAVQLIDYNIQNLPFNCTKKFSIAAFAKRCVKKRINKRLGIQDAIEHDIDQSEYDGMIYGHTHIDGFHRTPGGKLLINDGCGTEHVKFAVCDIYGKWGIITYHRDGIDVEMESGHKYFSSWQALAQKHGVSLDHFGHDPVIPQDQPAEKADTVLRLVRRLWPSEEVTASARLWESCVDMERGGALPIMLKEAFIHAHWKLQDEEKACRQPPRAQPDCKKNKKTSDLVLEPAS